VIVFNGGDFEYEGYFKILSKNEAILVIDNERKIKNQTNIELHLFQSIIKKDNFELIVEKCTEIGVSAFHPLISERSEKKDLNVERLNKIAKEAAEQSGKTKLSKIFNPEKLEKAIASFGEELFVLDFVGENLSKTISITKNKKIGILIGPEGGWSDNERIWLGDMGIKSVSIGFQILRAETAAIVASALILLTR
jgi:16S rRNA (uracil1498-N3)-methyltransferase